MLDQCTITRPSTERGPWDEETGTYGPPPDPATIYTGRCKLQTRDVQVNAPEVAGRQAFVVDWTIHLPVTGSKNVATGDVVTITKATLDEALQDKTFVVDGPHLGTAKTARRVPVRAEVSSWT